MDPRTGWPVQGVLSVAVLSDDATDGDALDNVLFVKGESSSPAFLRSLPNAKPIGAFLFLPDARAGYRIVRLAAGGVDAIVPP
jgi:thiamine biosynthesis lipoprotein ApbE